MTTTFHVREIATLMPILINSVTQISRAAHERSSGELDAERSESSRELAADHVPQAGGGRQYPGGVPAGPTNQHRGQNGEERCRCVNDGGLREFHGHHGYECDS